jgi:carbon storage regulator CsrA
MLVLSRDCNTVIRIGPNIRVKILSIRKQRVKLGVEAPQSVNVWREEIMRHLDEVELDGEAPASEVRGSAEELVCVVEDDPAHAGLIQKTLAREQFANSRVLGSGRDALSAFGLADDSPLEGDTMRPFLVLLDLHLPDVPGLDVLQAMRRSAHLSTVPVIVLSADDRQETVSRCLQAGANAFVPKADSFEGLRNSVGRIVRFWSDCCALPVARVSAAS